MVYPQGWRPTTSPLGYVHFWGTLGPSPVSAPFIMKFLLPARSSLVCGMMLAACWTSSHVGGQPADDPQTAQQSASSAVLAFQQSLANLIARVEPSVVAISRAPQPPAGGPAQQPTLANPFFEDFTGRANLAFQPTGSGVVIDAGGLVLTQYLNVQAGDRHRVTTSDGEKFDATLIGADPRSGLAVLKVETDKLVPLPIGKSENLRKGHFVVTVGNPYAMVAGDSATVGWGIVANLAQKAAPEMNLNNVRDELDSSYQTTLHHFGTLIQTDAKLGWSASGGALVDLEGNLVGITTAAATIPGHEQGAGYAIPMSEAMRRAVEQLKQGREVEYGLLGVSLLDLASRNVRSTVDKGVAIQMALSGSAAMQAGLQPQDVVVEIDGEPIESASELQVLVGGKSPGEVIHVRYLRGNEERETDVTLGKYYVQGEKVVTEKPPAWRGMRVDYATALPREAITQAEQMGRIDPQGCVVVSEVEEGSPAWESGVRPGRFISHVGTTRVTTPEEFRKAVAAQEGVVDLRFTDEERGNGSEVVPGEI
jgi:serine protease Do